MSLPERAEAGANYDYRYAWIRDQAYAGQAAAVTGAVPLPLEEAEGAFLLCGFLMALAAHQQGRAAEAIAWFERNRASCGPPGLLTEEFDVGQRQLRGNLPQAFVHALLLESAARLERPWVAR
jgi:GH15 family glucan-1,4-alpha-glucosidase